MELETTNKLYLELSQFVTATTGAELKLHKRIAELAAENKELKAELDKLNAELSAMGMLGDY